MFPVFPKITSGNSLVEYFRRSCSIFSPHFSYFPYLFFFGRSLIWLCLICNWECSFFPPQRDESPALIAVTVFVFYLIFFPLLLRLLLFAFVLILFTASPAPCQQTLIHIWGRWAVGGRLWQRKGGTAGIEAKQSWLNDSSRPQKNAK